LTHDGMQYDPMQGHAQGHGGPKIAKMTNFKVYFLCQNTCNQNN